MADAPSYDDLFRAGRNEILIKPTRFNPAVVDAEGSDVNVLVGFSASVGDEAVRFATAAFNEMHLGTAAQLGGAVLERFVWDRFKIERLDAGQSVVQLSFARTITTSAETFAAASVVSTADGQTFETVNDVVFPIGQSGPLLVDAFAQTAGTLGNVGAGTITTIVTNIGSTSTLTVTNPDDAAGGTIEESDEELSERARDFFVNARRGTRRAILNGALTTPGVQTASATEFLNTDSVPNFRVQLVIADANGNANATLAARVLTRLEEFRGLGVPVLVVPGIPQLVDIELQGITFPAGSNTTDQIKLIRTRVVDTVNRVEPNGVLQISRLMAAARISDAVGVPETAVLKPAGDLTPITGGVIRTTLSRVVVNGAIGS